MIVAVKPPFLPLGRRTAVASPREDKPTFEEVAVLALVNSTPSVMPVLHDTSLQTRKPSPAQSDAVASRDTPN
jgi:hypothetical protein